MKRFFLRTTLIAGAFAGLSATSASAQMALPGSGSRELLLIMIQLEQFDSAGTPWASSECHPTRRMEYQTRLAH